MEKRANEVFLNSHGVIETRFIGFQTQEALLSVRAEYERLCAVLQTENKSVLLLIDLEGVSKTDSGARAVAVSILKDLPFKKVAVYGGDIMMKIIAKLIITATESFISIRYFLNRSEAEQWLSQ